MCRKVDRNTLNRWILHAKTHQSHQRHHNDESSKHQPNRNDDSTKHQPNSINESTKYQPNTGMCTWYNKNHRVTSNKWRENPDNKNIIKREQPKERSKREKKVQQQQLEVNQTADQIQKCFGCCAGLQQDGFQRRWRLVQMNSMQNWKLVLFVSRVEGLWQMFFVFSTICHQIYRRT